MVCEEFVTSALLTRFWEAAEIYFFLARAARHSQHNQILTSFEKTKG